MMDVILVGGLWLDGGTIWRQVAEELSARGHQPIPVRLPGLGDGNTAATLADQVTAVVDAVDSADGKPLVVGHSAASTLAWLAADARPEQVASVALIGGFPSSDGELYADFFEPVDGAMPFPGWEEFEGPDSDDLDDAAKAELEAGAIPVPEGVTRATVSYTDPRRSEVPVTLVCPEFAPADAKAWIDAGDLPELARASRLDFVDLPTGHWPMVSAPGKLAGILADLADQHGSDG